MRPNVFAYEIYFVEYWLMNFHIIVKKFHYKPSQSMKPRYNMLYYN